MIKLFALVLLLALGIDARAGESWRITNTPTQQILRSVYFVDTQNGWVVGDSGTILHTIDGGVVWQPQFSGVTTNIAKVYFLDTSIGWAFAWMQESPYRTIILHTTNGGEEWTHQEYPVDEVFWAAIHFSDSLNGWMGGYNTPIVSTIDGGITWEPRSSGGNCPEFPVLDIKFLSSGIGLAVGGYMDISGVVLRSTNGGIDWMSTCTSPEPIQELHVFDSLNVVGVGGDFEYGSGIVRTTDGGITWEYEFLDFFGVATAVSFRTRAEGWAPLTEARNFMKTIDSGRTWQLIPTPQNLIVTDVMFIDSLSGFAVGEQGIILHYDTTMVSVHPFSPLPGSHTLAQNYPNPFNPRTLIAFEVSEATLVTLSVFDLLGREVTVLVNEEKAPGRYHVMFDASLLTSGVYFYRMRAGAFVHTRTALLVK